MAELRFDLDDARDDPEPGDDPRGEDDAPAAPGDNLFRAAAWAAPAAGLVLSLLGLIPGCCTPCLSAEPRATPQQPQQQAWQGVNAPPPVPARDTFAQPPDDGPDPNQPAEPPPVVPAVPVQPVAPEPAQPAVPTAPARPARMTTTTATTVTREASMIIDNHANGTVIVNSPGAAPPAVPAGQAPVQPAQFVQYQSLPAPAPLAMSLAPVQQVAVAAAEPVVMRQVLGRLYYSAGPTCRALGRTALASPAVTQVVAAPPQMVAAPQTLQYVQPATYLQAAPMMVQQVMQAAPVYAAPMPMVQQPVYAQPAPIAVASPQAAFAAPAVAVPAREKCALLNRLLGR